MLYKNCKLKPKVVVGNGHILIKPKHLNHYNMSLPEVSKGIPSNKDKKKYREPSQ
jgi:hypothetical protein